MFRYADTTGHVCAYYDSTGTFPTDVPGNAGKDGLGVIVLDMSNPAAPRRVANLTAAMLTPHESLQLNDRRDLLAAVAGNALSYPGVVDVYDLTQDCRAPRLLSSTPFGVLGHESAMSPDGLTFYVSSAAAHTVAAVDLTDPEVPGLLWFKTGPFYHGMSVSDDGRRLYAANDEFTNPTSGVDILDVSQIQERVLNPQVPIISSVTWSSKSIPQVPIPITVGKHKYLIEVDEFSSTADLVGAARIINIDDERKARVVANLRLQVNQPADRAGQKGDPGASNSQFGGYAAHYCAVPRRNDPGLVACTFILSGLRVFDIRDPERPREVAYFNKPPPGGSGALAAPAWDVARRQVWFSDTKSGFRAVQLTNDVGDLLDLPRTGAPAKPAGSRPERAPVTATPPAAPSSPGLPVTGMSAILAAGALLLLGASLLAQRRRTTAQLRRRS